MGKYVLKKREFCQPDGVHMMSHHWEHFRLAPCNSPASRSNLDKYLKIFENIYFLRSTFVLDRWYWYLDLQAQPWLQWSVLEKTSCLPWFPICLFVYLSGQSLQFVCLSQHRSAALLLSMSAIYHLHHLIYAAIFISCQFVCFRANELYSRPSAIDVTKWRCPSASVPYLSLDKEKSLLPGYNWGDIPVS